MKKPLRNPMGLAHLFTSFFRKKTISFILLFLSLLSTPYFAQGQTIATAAGTVTWTVTGTTNIQEVTLVENSTNHGDGFDNAMLVNVTGTNITFTNSYHLSSTYGAAIQHVAITNSGGTPSTFTLSSTGNLGSDGSTRWHYTSATGNYYTISSDQVSATTNGSDPVISLYYGNSTLNGYTTSIPFTNSSDAASFTISNVPIAAGATVRFLILAMVGNIDDATSNRPDQALLAVQNLANPNNWPADFTSFLTAPQKAQVMNWSAMSTLPLTWQSFTAQLQNEKVTLNWSTANEINTKDFIVQHSTDGSNWLAIGTVNAAGNSSTERRYNFIHTTPAKGNNYYRILQTDLDSRQSFSAVRKIIIGKNDNTITVLGNPVKNDKLTILLNETQPVSLFTADGKLMWQGQLAAGTQQIDVSQLSAGIYILKSAGTATQVVISR